jgi:pectate disaccharide-lyase
VLPGTLAHSASVILAKIGTESEPIKIWAADGGRPVIDFASQPRGDDRGIEIRGFYWHLRGLEIRNAADNGILISGSHNTVEDVILHHNDDTGLQIMVSENQATDDTLGVGNLVLNCDSYENWDEATRGENADGFAAKLRIGTGNVFRGSRAWNNADDGWDLFAADDVVRIEDCWSFLNGSTSRGSSPSGDGTGFKLGGRANGPGQGGAAHVVNGCSAFENQSCGFSLNNNTEEPTLSECGVADNDDGDYCDLDCASDSAVTISGSAAKTAQRNSDGSLPSIH